MEMWLAVVLWAGVTLFLVAQTWRIAFGTRSNLSVLTAWAAVGAVVATAVARSAMADPIAAPPGSVPEAASATAPLQQAYSAVATVAAMAIVGVCAQVMAWLRKRGLIDDSTDVFARVREVAEDVVAEIRQRRGKPTDDESAESMLGHAIAQIQIVGGSKLMLALAGKLDVSVSRYLRMLVESVVFRAKQRDKPAISEALIGSLSMVPPIQIENAPVPQPGAAVQVSGETADGGALQPSAYSEASRR